jgi:hypothetical protein
VVVVVVVVAGEVIEEAAGDMEEAEEGWGVPGEEGEEEDGAVVGPEEEWVDGDHPGLVDQWAWVVQWVQGGQWEVDMAGQWEEAAAMEEETSTTARGTWEEVIRTLQQMERIRVILRCWGWMGGRCYRDLGKHRWGVGGDGRMSDRLIL